MQSPSKHRDQISNAVNKCMGIQIWTEELKTDGVEFRKQEIRAFNSNVYG